MGALISSNLRDVWVRWDASPTFAGNGLLGGSMTFHDTLDVVRQNPAAADYLDLAPAIFEAQTDMDLIPGGTEIEGTSCTAANVGTYDIFGNGCGSLVYTCSAAGLCVEPPDHYDSLSIGMTFSALDAYIDGIYVE